MKLHIYLRQTSSERSTAQGRPSWFSHEICFANLLQTLLPVAEQNTVQLNIVFDGSEKDWDAHFTRRYLANETLAGTALMRTARVLRITGGAQHAAWMECYTIVARDMLESGQDDELLYFLENDYLHVPDWYQPVFAMAREYKDWDYISLYDHQDKYPNICTHHDAQRYHDLKSQIVVAGNHHWRTVASTCWSFILTSKTLERDHRVLNHTAHDHKKFIFLTRVLRRRLFTPMPGLSTHCMAPLLSPCIAWEKIASNAAEFGRLYGKDEQMVAGSGRL